MPHEPMICGRAGRSGAELLLSARDPRSDTREVVHAWIMANPAATFALISAPTEQTGLTDVGRWRALDVIIDVIGDDEIARTLIRDFLSVASLHQVMNASYDLPSASAHLVPIDILLAALFASTATRGRDPDALLSTVLGLRRWLEPLQDRPDYQELLDYSVEGWTLRKLLAIAVALEKRHGEDELHEMDDADLWLASVDIDDPIVEAFGNTYDLRDFSASRIARVLADRARAREERLVAPSFVAPDIADPADLGGGG
jgi:hypothetical protein